MGQSADSMLLKTCQPRTLTYRGEGHQIGGKDEVLSGLPGPTCCRRPAFASRFGVQVVGVLYQLPQTLLTEGRPARPFFIG